MTGAVLTLRGFLHALFPANVADDQIHVTSFPGSPQASTAQWQGYRLSHLKRDPPPADHNVYFALGVLDASRVARLAGNVIASPLIGLDDVGTKVPVDRVRTLLTDRGIRPVAVVETSPYNHSLYYRIGEPDGPRELRAVRAAALRRHLGVLGLTDPATTDPARYMRAPFGVNGKHGTPVTLKQWNPSGPMTPFDVWASAVMGTVAQQRALNDAESGTALWHLDERHASMNDPWVKLAAEVGLAPYEGQPGVVQAICPFGHEHSGDDQTGFAFIAWGTMKCHHGHCASRKSIDFQNEIIRRYDQAIAIGMLMGTYTWTRDDTRVLDAAGHAVPGTGQAFLAVHSFDDGDDRDRLTALGYDLTANAFRVNRTKEIADDELDP